MRRTIPILAAMLLFSCSGGCALSSAKSKARSMPLPSLAKTTAIEAREVQKDLRQASQTVANLPPEQFEAAKSGIVANLNDAAKRVGNVADYAEVIHERAKNLDSASQRLERWGTITVFAGMVMAGFGVLLIFRSKSSMLLYAGLTTVGIGLMTVALAKLLWPLLILSGLGLLGIVAWVGWRRDWFHRAGRAVVASIDRGIEAGVITTADRKSLKDVLDPIQGQPGKALVDEVKAEAAKARGAVNKRVK